jgi:hypothetical protein
VPATPFPVDTLTVRPWADDVIDEIGFDPRSPYVERYWLSVLGPTATWLVRRLADGLEVEPAGFELDVDHTARSLGLGGKGGKHSPFMRSVERICQYGAAQQIAPEALRVRRRLPPLTRHQVERLPEPLRADHARWVTRPRPGSAQAVEQLRRRSRRLALSLLELGEDVEATERQLLRWKLHPAIAREGTAWALARHRAAADAAGLTYDDDTTVVVADEAARVPAGDWTPPPAA